MRDEAKTKEQLIIELKALRQSLVELKAKGGSTDPAGLRSRAEGWLKSIHNETDRVETDDRETLCHELQVHQIELEMQNNELRNAMIQVEESRKGTPASTTLPPLATLRSMKTDSYWKPT